MVFLDGSTYEGEVIGDLSGSSNKDDLALIRIKKTSAKPLPLSPSLPDVGSDIAAIGAPQGLEFTLTKGVVSQIRNNGDILQIDAAINPGNSGGPVLNKSGCVVGVSTFILKDSEGLNFAVASKPVTNFIDQPRVLVNRWKTLSHGSYLAAGREKSAEGDDIQIKFFELPKPASGNYDFYSKVIIKSQNPKGDSKDRELEVLVRCSDKFVLQDVRPNASPGNELFIAYQVKPSATGEWGQPFNASVIKECKGPYCLNSQFLEEWAKDERYTRTTQISLNYYCKAGLNKNIVSWYLDDFSIKSLE